MARNDCHLATRNTGRIVLTLLAPLLAQGCAAAPRTCHGAPPEATRTEAVRVTPFRHEAADATCLQAFRVEPVTDAAPRAVAVVAHGLRDHATRYEELAAALVRERFVVYAQDMRGHARSGGPRQRWDSMDELTSDLDRLIAKAKSEHPGRPVFLFGHSLGGLISTRYVLERPDAVNGLVLSGAALALTDDVGGFDKAAARFFSVVIPGLPAQKLDDTVFVRDDAAKQALASDPLIVHDKLPARSAAVALNAIEDVGTRMESIAVPLLVMHGTQDVTTNVEGSKALYARAKSADKTLKLWDGLYHDLLHEPERAEVVALVVSWMKERAPAPDTQGEAARVPDAPAQAAETSR
jgi:alpha-beta hydrolase superfamily lysophospholipase